MRYEYRIVPAPQKIKKYKGAKTPADRFARTIAAALNAEGADGWEYLRAETLPAEERRGLTGRTSVFHTMLVFRRPLGEGEIVDEDLSEDDDSEALEPGEIAAPPMRALRPDVTFHRSDIRPVLTDQSASVDELDESAEPDPATSDEALREEDSDDGGRS